MDSANNVADVFVVDDEPLIADALSSLLRLFGLAVETYYDGRSALSQFPERTPKVLVTDLRMPVMDGHTLAESASSISPSCKILVLSGDPYFLAHKRAFEVLAKPVAPKELIKRVMELATA